jgi:hypothetical protein
VELSEHRFTIQEVLVSHANAALTPVARLRIGRLVVDDGVPVAPGGRDVPGVLADRQAVG